MAKVGFTLTITETEEIKFAGQKGGNTIGHMIDQRITHLCQDASNPPTEHDPVLTSIKVDIEPSDWVDMVRVFGR